MTTNLQPLSWNTMIVNKDGTPTVQFMRFLQDHNLLIGDNTDEVATLSAATINVTAPITGGGLVKTSPIVGLANSGVTPSVYGDATHSPQITVDAHGLITHAEDVLISGGSGGSTPAIVQAVAARTSGTLTFGVNTTVGNTILVLFIGGNGPTAAPTGTQNAWYTTTNIMAIGNEFVSGFIKPADGTTMATSVNSGDNGSWIMYEISNFGGVSPMTYPIKGGTGASFVMSGPPKANAITIFGLHSDAGNVFTYTPGTDITLDYNYTGGGNHPALWAHIDNSDSNLITFTNASSTIYVGLLWVWGS